jgi:hypothetical protein
MSPIAAGSAAAVTKFTPGSVSSRRISTEASRYVSQPAAVAELIEKAAEEVRSAVH